MSLLICLRYGVSRVNLQQWDYLLTDAQAAQNSMKALFKIVRHGQLDQNAGKAQ
jgi:meiotic recombination protein REC8